MDLDHGLDDDLVVDQTDDPTPCLDCGRTEPHEHALLDFLWPGR